MCKGMNTSAQVWDFSFRTTASGTEGTLDMTMDLPDNTHSKMRRGCGGRVGRVSSLVFGALRACLMATYLGSCHGGTCFGSGSRITLTLGMHVHMHVLEHVVASPLLCSHSPRVWPLCRIRQRKQRFFSLKIRIPAPPSCSLAVIILPFS
jgi:hypothetical protein